MRLGFLCFFPLIHTKSILSHLFNTQLNKTLVITDIDLKCSREEKRKCWGSVPPNRGKWNYSPLSGVVKLKKRDDKIYEYIYAKDMENIHYMPNGK